MFAHCGEPLVRGIGNDPPTRYPSQNRARMRAPTSRLTAVIGRQRPGEGHVRSPRTGKRFPLKKIRRAISLRCPSGALRSALLRAGIRWGPH